MYQYDSYDKRFLAQRVNQLSNQVKRFTSNELDEDKFRSLRLKNGLYQELHAYMLRVAIPYGLLNTKQIRQLAYIADKYDRGYGHFTTRQNIQFNWIKLEQASEVLADLAKVDMHAIQTSGKLVRNITTDYLTGSYEDEVADPRPYCEVVRQWFTEHPEFSWLSGKFKIAISGGSDQDTSAIMFHDLGLRLTHNQNNQLGFIVYVGGGLGAFPVVAQKLCDFVPEADLLDYVESILRIYNLQGYRNKNKKHRFKFLIRDLGIPAFKQLVDDDQSHTRLAQASMISNQMLNNEFKMRSNNAVQTIKAKAKFVSPIGDIDITTANTPDANYKIWQASNSHHHKIKGYTMASVSLSGFGVKTGNATSAQLNALADLADKYSQGEIRVSNRHSLAFPYVKQSELYELWQCLDKLNLANPYHNTIAHIVCCPGADYCSLAKTSSISMTQKIQQKFDSITTLLKVGQISLHISGCENSCAHHHVADIGLLGLQKSNQDFYQITLAGSSDSNHSVIGKKIGASISAEKIVDAIEKIVTLYVAHKQEKENFSQVFNRIGLSKFKEVVYAK